MNNIDRIIIKEDFTLRDTMKKIDESGKGIVLVVDKEDKLVGTITDGDTRRAILNETKLEDSVKKIFHRNPVCALEGSSKEVIKDLFIKKAIKQLPIVSKDGVPVDIININEILVPRGKKNKVIIMAGGLGTRLGSLTEDIPKPMLRVGDEPLLYHIVENFKKYGYNDILISINYRGEIIENYFQDGYAYGLKIDYIKENKRLGTAGGIKLAEGYIKDPFFVINGDIFSNIDVEKMMEFHLDNRFDLTIGIRKYSQQIPYGVLKVDENSVQSIEEKPRLEFKVSGGIYCLNPELISMIPNDEYFEITDLIDRCLKEGFKVGAYEIKEYWIDIGRLEDYEKVNREFLENGIEKI